MRGPAELTRHSTLKGFYISAGERSPYRKPGVAMRGGARGAALRGQPAGLSRAVKE